MENMMDAERVDCLLSLCNFKCICEGGGKGLGVGRLALGVLCPGNI